jgi:hypothetical protein
MKFLQRPLLLLFALLGGIASLVFELSRPGVEPRAPLSQPAQGTGLAPADLVVQLEGLKAEKTASLTKVASLEAEVRQLRKELAVRTRDTGERAQKQQSSARAAGDPVTGASEETPFSKSVLELAVKAGCERGKRIFGLMIRNALEVLARERMERVFGAPHSNI